MPGHDIFVSYSREDRSAAQRVAARLENEGFSVWWDAAIHSGESFDEVIERQLRAAKAAVVLWSPRSVASRWVRAEATLADRRKILVPVIIEPCDLPIIFELTHTNDLSAWDGDRNAHEWQRLVDDLRFLIDPQKDAPPSPPAKARGFLLSGDVEEPETPYRSSSPPPRVDAAAPAPSPVSVKPATSPAPSAEVEYEQTAFYTQAETDLHLGDGTVHCLEAGPVEAPIVSHPIGLFGAKLGRSAPADIIFADKRISRRHCSIEVRNGEMLVTDLQSTNGTFVDGERIDVPTVLAPESELKLGDVVLVHRVRALADLS